MTRAGSSVTASPPVAVSRFVFPTCNVGRCCLRGPGPSIVPVPDPPNRHRIYMRSENITFGQLTRSAPPPPPPQWWSKRWSNGVAKGAGRWTPGGTGVTKVTGSDSHDNRTRSITTNCGTRVSPDAVFQMVLGDLGNWEHLLNPRCSAGCLSCEALSGNVVTPLPPGVHLLLHHCIL